MTQPSRPLANKRRTDRSTIAASTTSASEVGIREIGIRHQAQRRPPNWVNSKVDALEIRERTLPPCDSLVQPHERRRIGTRSRIPLSKASTLRTRMPRSVPRPADGA